MPINNDNNLARALIAANQCLDQVLRRQFLIFYTFTSFTYSEDQFNDESDVSNSLKPKNLISSILDGHQNIWQYQILVI